MRRPWAASAASVLAVLLLAVGSEVAYAYRPFDSTDADVARPGEFELELGPVGWLREGSKRFAVVPAVVANYGLRGERELVVEGQREVALDPQADEPRTAVVDDGVFIKQVLREGQLQDGNGPSIATEYGVLLPEINGASGTGFSIAGIVSQRSGAGTMHFNAAIARTREHRDDLFLGVILEGPYAWSVRPVAEVFREQTSKQEPILSALVGAIWRVQDGLSFDVGVRRARESNEAIHELRLGLTWALH